MKRRKILFFILIISYLFLMCSKKTADEHTHDGEDAHTHEAEVQPAAADEHIHEGEDAHTHEADAQTPQNEIGGIIAVEAEWADLIGLKVEPAKTMSIDLLVSVPGQIIPNQNQVAVITPFIESSVNCIFVNIGDWVNEGDLLLCLTSPEIGFLRAEYDKSKANLEINRQNFDRRQKLFAENIISEKSFQEAELQNKVAAVNYDYARKKLIAMGIEKGELENPPSDHTDAVGSTVHITAPISGYITYRNVSLGQKVDNSSKMFEIINLENVWVEADIFEKDLTKIKIGQLVKVRVSAYPGTVFSGEIFYIGNTLNKDTKTIKILVEIPNKAKKLKPGMFANTNIVVAHKQNAFVIPKEAILEDENLQVVFVKEGDGYHRHTIKIGIVSDKYVEILSGLEPNSLVVTVGNYQLKSKMKMEGIDPHAGHSH